MSCRQWDECAGTVYKRQLQQCRKDYKEIKPIGSLLCTVVFQNHVVVWLRGDHSCVIDFGNTAEHSSEPIDSFCCLFGVIAVCRRSLLTGLTSLGFSIELSRHCSIIFRGSVMRTEYEIQLSVSALIDRSTLKPDWISMHNILLGFNHLISTLMLCTSCVRQTLRHC